MFNNEIILVTGGTGSWGHELVKQLLPLNPKEIRIFSRNESNQFAMKQEFDHHPKLRFIIGDIKEKHALINASQDVDYIFHLAALKHVPVCEEQPIEALKTNVIGTQNVIDAAINGNVKKVIYVSTDKASDPSNFYGLSKAMGEKLIIHANTLNTKTRFVCIRGGNVLGTNGSVIHVFKKQIQDKKKVGITDLNMTRFFLTVEDAIKLVFKATFESIGGEIFVMKMPTCRIVDLAQVLIEASNIKSVEIEILGIRPGEKIHELLLSEYESTKTVVFDNEYFIILPAIYIKGLKEHYSKFKSVNIKNYNSSTGLMTKEEIKDMLMKGGFI
ncbi:polysaccharide biosynthesis protein [Metabacillus sediminilitoris]|uniref:NAD-dependent epimerase/dehydratase family protein n=1 Tax=Metabacillus sediminilitoris TaxID=2567941 RepID=A0A4S4BV00_9BACI|nr:polysaccharide biosynthesis protein [Metabacillus sediminilitoris]QGQ44726.1 NAD-dependent epimerase/dehydratase family protein [Metabacillus sediminilitoris]THF78926.1 NAD-dependent epimerase/dehydratase family protein [Metabacillus sediminilitoris]